MTREKTLPWLVLPVLLALFLLFGAQAAGEGLSITYTVAQDTTPHQELLLESAAWYPVPEFVSGQRYLLAVEEGDSTLLFTAAGEGQLSAAWTYSLNSMGGSTTAVTSSLTSLTYSVSWDTDAFQFSQPRQLGMGGPPPAGGGKPPEMSGGLWAYEGGRLTYTAKSVTYYLTWDGTAFGCTEDPAQAAAVTLYTDGPELGRCIAAQPTAAAWAVAGSGYDPPVYTVETTLTAPEVAWYVDGQEAGTGVSFTASALAGLTETGRHTVYCVVSGRQDGFAYRETSAPVHFFLSSGVLENSFLIFSDVHEQFENIGAAIEAVMESSGGKIPALIVCTGDWVNGSLGKSETVLSQVYLPQLREQLGRLDAVFVGGNHDSMDAAVAASLDAGLGATAEGLAGGAGVIFDSKTAAVSGTNSALATGLVVYGINYYALETGEGYSYAPVLDGLEAFLAQRAANYQGELVVIAAHAGLHTLENWNGGGEYNVNASASVAALLNRYAQEHHMDILFLFGHDHTKQEEEFFLGRGDTLVSTESYADGTTATQTLAFLYGHAGYLNDNLAGNKHYSLFTWTGESIQRTFGQVGGSETVSSYPRLAGLTLPEPEAEEDDSPADEEADFSITPTYGEAGTLTALHVTVSQAALGADRAVTLPLTLRAADSPERAVALTLTLPDLAPARVQVNVENPGPGVVALLRGEDGTLTPVQDCCGSLTVPVRGSCTLLIVENGRTFPDTEGHWAQDAISFVTARGIFKGTDQGFGPELPMSRAMMAQILYNFDAGAAPGLGSAFGDVAQDAWYADAVGWASSLGYLRGYGQTFGPEDTLSRQDLVTILYRYALQNGGAAAPSLTGWPDADQVADYARVAMAWAVQVGILKGIDGRLEPGLGVTRAQAAAMLCRYVSR